MDVGSDLPCELQKPLISHCVFNVLRVLVVFNINADLGWILVPTWLHFGAVWAPKTRLGSVLGHLGGMLGRLGSVLAPSWGVLGRLGRILRRLGRVLGRLGRVLGRLGASWSVKPPQKKPGLATEREARVYSSAVALF